ncbi:uncharacterized protein [Chaetodon trifascialis]|uniref:uncharacterized protein n=1 Tax=Chaetodon trifascialis TaxID=109706 RepID=UPI0039938F3D
MFSQAEMCFLAEYAKTMAPVAKALNVLQGDVKVSMGHHLPTIAVLISKLENVRLSLKYCQLLVDALLGGVEKRFGEMMSDPELIAAAILQPMFKTTWTTDDVLQRGLGYIKEHLPSYDEPPLQPNDSSSTSDEDDFFSGLKHTHTQETTKQLDTYLACTSEGMDIFTPCPAVARLSLKLNTGLPASAACERLFSTAGLLFTPRRGRIHSQNLENQLLLKLNKAFFDFRKTATHR